MEAINISNWLVCGNCGCKLGKIEKGGICKKVEIKCHQCKTINKINIIKEK